MNNSAIYARRFRGSEDYRLRVWRVLCRSYFDRYTAGRIVLDIGCGYGEFIRSCKARQKFALDANPHARANLPSHIAFTCGYADEDVCYPKNLDVVFTSNFLEHLRDKAAVETVLRRAHDALVPGGIIVCLGPNANAVGGAYWDFLDHHVALTDRSMAEALELCGFKVVKRIPRFLPYTMSQGFKPPVWFVWLYLKLPFLRRLFGGQFLVVAVRTAQP